MLQRLIVRIVEGKLYGKRALVVTRSATAAHCLLDMFVAELLSKGFHVTPCKGEGYVDVPSPDPGQLVPARVVFRGPPCGMPVVWGAKPPALVALDNSIFGLGVKFPSNFTDLLKQIC